MAESREYIIGTSADGSVNISEEVVAVIAIEAMSEVEGFGGTVNALGNIAELIGKKSASKGIRVTSDENGIIIDAFVSVKYGHSVADVARSIQSAVFKAVSDMTGAAVSAVNVNVSGIQFENK
ncbi:MAG: Asp23/Gls24 family envelope stress response protein [Oscillospiraceae bacterium]|nr:Asp23/Gls24 family envelope stress response protein [Oscillospiraceae bacterium]